MLGGEDSTLKAQTESSSWPGGRGIRAPGSLLQPSATLGSLSESLQIPNWEYQASYKNSATLRLSQPGSVSVPWPVLIFPESPKVLELS